MTATYDGKPCRTCGRTLRYVSSGQCVAGRRTTASRWAATHPDEVRAKSARHYAANRDAYKKNHVEWSAANPGKLRDIDHRKRARKAGTSSGPVDEAKVFDNYHGICYMCQQPLDAKEWHLEHVLPLSKGGTHTMSNLAPACSDCNLVKRAMVSYSMVRRAMQLYVLHQFGFSVYQTVAPVIADAVRNAVFYGTPLEEDVPTHVGACATIFC